MPTRTRSFGAGNRESHDAAPFYERFTAPELSDDDTVNPCGASDSLMCGDARDMDAVADSSVALVVTSPPYFAGKEYEAALGEGHVPGSYLEYLAVLRDLTERVVVASKGRFDRAVSRADRERRGLPFENTISKEEFFAATLDVWEIRPEHARRVGHPAPFPVELPERLIQLYTYRGDVVLDPFLGSGSTAVAAVRTDRRYVGYDTDPSYVALAEGRIAAEHAA